MSIPSIPLSQRLFLLLLVFTFASCNSKDDIELPDTNLHIRKYPFDLPQFQNKGDMNRYGLTPESMLSVNTLGYDYDI